MDKISFIELAEKLNEANAPKYVIIDNGPEIRLAACYESSLPSWPAGVVLHTLQILRSLTTYGDKYSESRLQCLDEICKRIQRGSPLPVATLGSDGIGDSTWVELKERGLEGNIRSETYTLDNVLSDKLERY